GAGIGAAGARGAAAGASHSAAGAAAPAGARAQATPAVRNLAKQLGVALESIPGSGPGGSITAGDVKRAANGVAAPGAGAASAGRSGGGVPVAPSGAIPAQPSRGESTATARAPALDEPAARIPLRRLRRKIAEHMRRSIATP